MPVYLDTRGNTVLSVAVCDRCSRKFAYTDLMPDPNFPGMRVCKDDLDKFDPWRLPARQTENIALRFPRPDVSVALQPNLLNTQGDPNSPPQYDNFLIEGTPYGIAGSPGNLNTQSKFISSPSPLTPFIYSVAPGTGPQSGGTVVTITGANFESVVTVKFGGQVATFSITSPTEIQATSPAYPVTGVVDVSAASTYGTAVSHGAFTYT
jgi:hypothetical protein